MHKYIIELYKAHFLNKLLDYKSNSSQSIKHNYITNNLASQSPPEVCKNHYVSRGNVKIPPLAVQNVCHKLISLPI